MNYAKNKNQINFYIFSVFFVVGFFIFFTIQITRAEDTVDKLNQQKQDRQEKLKEINKQIKGYTQQIDQTRKTANTLKNELAIYEKQIAVTQLQIEAKNTQILDTQTQIEQIKKQIEEKNRQIEENKTVLSELLNQLNNFSNQYDLKTALGSENFSNFLDQIENTQNFQEKIYQVTQKVKSLKAELEEKQKDLNIQLLNLKELQHQLEITKESLDAQRVQKQLLLNQTRGLEKNYQKLLSKSKQDEQALEKEIQDLDNTIRSKLGKKTILVSKGVLAWPMDGVLTQKYGNTGFTALGYNFHNGIDIAAPAGEPIYSVADGEVIYTDESDASYGNWVAIKHTIDTKNGKKQIVTLYAHMKSFRAKVGQKIKLGDIVGYQGNTGNTTKKLYGPERGYHIHFGVYDAEGFGVNEGKYTQIYGPYKIPFGYTYNPLDFLGS